MLRVFVPVAASLIIAGCSHYDDGIDPVGTASAAIISDYYAPQDAGTISEVSYGVPINGIAMLDGDRANSAPPPVQATTTHFCDYPVANGSDEQSRCFEAAHAACPEGQSPRQVVFDEATFQIRGYGCS